MTASATEVTNTGTGREEPVIGTSKNAAASMTRDTQFLYASARIRSMENSMVTGERLERLLEMKNASDVLSAIGDCGFLPVHREDGSTDREATLDAVLEGAYRTVLGMVPEPEVFRFMQYPYDCNNIKAALKAFTRGIDPMDMMFGIGTVPPEAVAKMPETKDWSLLPTHMAKAAGEAAEAYAKTLNPQKIDLILDRACYEDMLEFVLAGRSEYAIRLVKTKIDLTNFMIAIRILRMGGGRVGEALLHDALLPGGTVSLEEIFRLYGEGETKFVEALTYGAYAPFAKRIQSGNGTLAEIECASDDEFMEYVRKAKMVPFGYEVAIGYLYGMEYAVKNVRIILAGKDAGLASEVLRERVRTSYV